MIELSEILDSWLAEEYPQHRFHIYYSDEVPCECRYVVKLRGRTVCHIMDDYLNVRTGATFDGDEHKHDRWVKVDMVEPDSFDKLRKLLNSRLAYISETDDFTGRPPE